MKTIMFTVVGGVLTFLIVEYLKKSKPVQDDEF